MKRYNVVIYNYQEFNVNIGGIERVSVSLANRLLTKNINIFLVSIYKSPYSSLYTTPIPITFLPSKDACSEVNIDLFHKLLNDNNIDILINQTGHSLASHNLCYRAIQGTTTKLISVLHFCPSLRELHNKYPWDDNIFTFKENCMRLLKSIGCKWPFNKMTFRDIHNHYNKMYKESNKVVLLSENYFSEYVRLGRLSDSEKLVGINNMLSFSLCNENINKEKKILYCGRMETQKRPERVLYVWSKLQDRLPDWSIDIIGDGSLMERVKSLSFKLKLKNIEFYGFKESKDFFRKSRILIQTSDFEGWPLTIMEAMQNKCVPVVMNTYASLQDIIYDGYDGYLISDCNCDEMADKIYELATDENKWRKMSLKAFQKMEKFTPDIIIGKWLKLFDEISTGY